MSAFRWFLAVGVVVGFGAAVVSSGPTSSPPPTAPPPTAPPPTAPPPTAPGMVIEPPLEPDIGVCELLSLAARADPALQYGAGRPIADVLDAAALQRALLSTAADLLGPGPEAVALSALADAFVDANDPSAPPDWTEQQWADALMARDDPALVVAVETIELGC